MGNQSKSMKIFFPITEKPLKRYAKFFQIFQKLNGNPLHYGFNPIASSLGLTRPLEFGFYKTFFDSDFNEEELLKGIFNNL